MRCSSQYDLTLCEAAPVEAMRFEYFYDFGDD